MILRCFHYRKCIQFTKISLTCQYRYGLSPNIKELNPRCAEPRFHGVKIFFVVTYFLRRFENKTPNVQKFVLRRTRNYLVVYRLRTKWRFYTSVTFSAFDVTGNTHYGTLRFCLESTDFTIGTYFPDFIQGSRPRYYDEKNCLLIAVVFKKIEMSSYVASTKRIHFSALHPRRIR